MLVREGICGSLRCLRNDLSAPQNRWKQHFGRIWIKDVYLMKKATIIFGSTTGNTETVADMIAENMADYEVKIVYVTDAKDDSSVQEADLVLYGCSTMGLGELQEDFIPYYESRMTSTLLKGKDVAVSGGGNSALQDALLLSESCSRVYLIHRRESFRGEQKLVEAVKRMGGIAPKFVSPGLNGVPDRIVLLPDGHMAFVELKSPGKKMRPLQMKRKKQLEGLGFRVYCIDGAGQIGGVIDEIRTT